MLASGDKVTCPACKRVAPLLARTGAADRMGSHLSGEMTSGAWRDRCPFSGGTTQDAARGILPDERWRGDKLRRRVELGKHSAPLGVADWAWYQEFCKRERGE